MAAKKKATREVKTNIDGAAELEETVKAIHGRFGENSFHRASQKIQPDRISSGIFMLDFALLGGWPHNRTSMILGERHAGKSMLGDLAIASAQWQFPDMTAVKIDVENTHDTVWSTKLGVDPERLLVFSSETGESAVDSADALVRTKEVSLIVVDSIAALTPMKELDSSAEDDAQPGMQARLTGSMIRKLTSGMIAERNRGHFVTVLFLNQFRAKIGGYGDPRSVPGGRAAEYAPSVQMIIKNKEKPGKDSYGVEGIEENEHAFHIQKNKLNAGPREGEFRLRRIDDPERGVMEGMVDEADTMLAYAAKFGAWTGAGASFKLEFWDEEHNFTGVKGDPAKEQAERQLYADAELKWKLRNFLICEQAQHLGMPAEFYERFYPE